MNMQGLLYKLFSKCIFSTRETPVQFQQERCCWSPFYASGSAIVVGVNFVVAILRLELRSWSVNLDL